MRNALKFLLLGFLALGIARAQQPSLQPIAPGLRIEEISPALGNHLIAKVVSTENAQVVTYMLIAGLDGTVPVALKVGSDGTLVTGADPGGTIQQCNNCIVVSGLSGGVNTAIKVGADGTVAISGGGGGGTVTSVGLIGTANEITVTGSSPITGSGSWTLSIPNSPTLPGTTTGTFSGNVTGNVTGTAGSAAKWTTARNLAGNSVDGSANVAFSNAFIVQGTTDTGLTGAQFLGALGTGPLKNTTTTGILSIAAASDIYALWGGSCGSTTYLSGSGACSTPPGTNTFNPASPGTIGGTTPGAITGTTITANTAFAGALNGTVGATTPSTGVFTTLSTSSTVNFSALTPSQCVATDGSSNLVSTGSACGSGTIGGSGSAAFLPYFSGTNTVSNSPFFNVIPAVGATVFTGSGLNDGTFTGPPTVTGFFTVVIDGTGTPDTFKWSVNGAQQATLQPISAGPISLSGGVSITFLATTGHTLSDQWASQTTGCQNPLYPASGSNQSCLQAIDSGDGTVTVGTDQISIVNWQDDTSQLVFRDDSLIIQSTGTPSQYCEYGNSTFYCIDSNGLELIDFAGGQIQLGANGGSGGTVVLNDAVSGSSTLSVSSGTLLNNSDTVLTANGYVSCTQATPCASSATTVYTVGASDSQLAIHANTSCTSAVATATAILTITYVDPSGTTQTITQPTATCTTLGVNSVAATSTVVRVQASSVVQYSVAIR